MSRRAAPGLLALLAALGCEAEVGVAREQWTITVTTDAPIPQLGDRVLVELLDAQGDPACSTCRRQFGVTPASDEPGAPPPTFPLSFGVVPEDGDIALVRVRLYRAERLGEAGVPAGPHIEASGRLPDPAGSVVEVGLRLHADCFGVHGDAAAGTTCDPASRSLVETRTLEAGSADDRLETGSWPPAQPVPCGAEPSTEMACIEGGVFLLGGADPFEGLAETAALPERLVRLAPFAIDREEMTVGEVRALMRDGRVAGSPLARDADDSQPLGGCTFPADVEDGSRDGYPVDCLSRVFAQSVCGALGKRLPTEVEWEFAAGGRTLELDHPWGDDERTVCEKAVVGNGRGTTELADLEVENVDCRIDEIFGPRIGGAAGDVTPQGVRNMAGNVEELVADLFFSYQDPCWDAGPGLDNAPSCSADLGPATRFSVRGGSWRDPPVRSRVFLRKAGDGQPQVGRGFRCAASM